MTLACRISFVKTHRCRTARSFWSDGL